MFSLEYSYTTPDNNAFDDTKIIVDGNARLVPAVVPGTASLYTKLDEIKGFAILDDTGNGCNGAFQGGFDSTNRVAGKINNGLVGDGLGFVNFGPVLPFLITDDFTMELWVKTSGVVTQSLIAKQRNSGAFDGFSITMSAGKARTVVRDSLGNIRASESSSTINNNIFRHVVARYDGSTQDLEVFIDGSDATTATTTDTLTSTLASGVDFQISGRDGSNLPLTSATIVDEIVIYPRKLTNADITFRYNLGAGTQVLPGSSTTFPTDSPTVVPNADIIATELLSFSATITETGADTLTFVLIVGAVDMWWNGSIWEPSTGVAQSNIAADINANLASLLSTRSVIAVKAFITSDDGSTTPELDDVVVNFDLTETSDTINTTKVFGRQVNADGTPATNTITVTFPSSGVPVEVSTQLTHQVITVIPDSLGNWEVGIVSSDVEYEFTFVDNTETRLVPDVTEISYNALTG